MLSQRKTCTDRIKHSATRWLSRLLSIRSMRLLPLPGAPRTSGSDLRKFKPNTAISGKQSHLRAHIVYLSTHDRCELFRCCALSVPCSLRRSSRNRTSSLSVSLGLGIRPVAFCHRPSFCLEYRLSPFQDAEVALWSNHGRRLKAAVLGIPPQFQVNFFKPQFNGPLLSPHLAS